MGKLWPSLFETEKLRATHQTKVYQAQGYVTLTRSILTGLILPVSTASEAPAH